MKAILVIDMPKNCKECQLLYEKDACYGKNTKDSMFLPLVCNGSSGEYRVNQFPYDKKRVDWCPLRPIPNRNPISKEEIANEDDYEARKFAGAFNRGWNNCLDEIGGKREKNER